MCLFDSLLKKKDKKHIQDDDWPVCSEEMEPWPVEDNSPWYDDAEDADSWNDAGSWNSEFANNEEHYMDCHPIDNPYDGLYDDYVAKYDPINIANALLNDPLLYDFLLDDLSILEAHDRIERDDFE